MSAPDSNFESGALQEEHHGSRSENRRIEKMTDGLASIITLLEQRKTAIEKVLNTLREVSDDMPEWVSASTAKPERVRKKRSAAVRKRMREAQLRRWQKVRGE
jgi:hypothetical protein